MISAKDHGPLEAQGNAQRRRNEARNPARGMNAKNIIAVFFSGVLAAHREDETLGAPVEETTPEL